MNIWRVKYSHLSGEIEYTSTQLVSTVSDSLGDIKGVMKHHGITIGDAPEEHKIVSAEWIGRTWD